MNSLSKHILAGPDHGALPFNADCHVCRMHRLSGTLPEQRLVPARGVAVVLSGAMLVTAAAPAASLADGLVVNPRPGADVVPVEEDAQEEPEEEGEPAPEEVIEGTAAPDGPDDGAADAPSPNDPDAPPPPAAAAPEPAAPAPEPAAPAPGPAAPAPAAAAPAPAPPAAPAPAAASFHAQASAPAPDPAPAPEPPPPVVAAAPASQQAVVQSSAAAPAAATQKPSSTGDSSTHVVAAGESLWSIAKRELGADASTAAVARLVDRIWNLNSERIATGDPDMLMVGTALRLP